MSFLHGDFMITETNDYCSVKRYVGTDVVITIPETIHGKKVKIIGAMAFQGMVTLQSVYLPDCVEVVDHHAFSGCKALVSIRMGNEVRILGANCFEACVSLCEVQLSSSLQMISDSAFEGCISLRQIYVHPKSVIALAPNVFRGCLALKQHKKVVSRADVDNLPSVALHESTGETNSIRLGFCYAQRHCSVCSFVCAGLLMTSEDEKEVYIYDMVESEWELKVYE